MVKITINVINPFETVVPHAIRLSTNSIAVFIILLWSKIDHYFKWFVFDDPAFPLCRST